MYVRRKVFSVLSDETGEERLFSTNEVEYLGYDDYEIDDQREYSEFDDEDEDQREFADSDDSKLKKAAKILGISTAALGTAVVGGKLAGKGIRRVKMENIRKAAEKSPAGGMTVDALNNFQKAKSKKYASEKPYDAIKDAVKKGYYKAKISYDRKFNKSKFPTVIDK